MDSLKRFFLPKTILKFKKGWEKIGLWIPLFVFFQVKKLVIFEKWLDMNLLNDFSQINNFENSKG